MIVKTLTRIEERPEPINKLIAPPNIKETNVASFMFTPDI